MKAVWKNVTLAESDDTIVRSGGHYFPPDSINEEHFQKSNAHTTCPIKGQASCYHISVDGETIEDGAWYYPEPHPTARAVKNYVAFHTNRGVEVVP